LSGPSARDTSSSPASAAGAPPSARVDESPVIVRQVSDDLALEMTLVENIQREDLNAIEAARAFEA